MSKNNMTIALYPNHRGLGYVACFNPNDIVHYGVGNIKILSPNNYVKRLMKFIQRYQPDVVLLKEYNQAGVVVSDRVKKVIDRLEYEAFKKGLKVYRYSRNQVREVFSQYGDTNKYSISKTLAHWYSDLQRFIAPPRTFITAEDYYMGIFDAFSLMYTHFTLAKTAKNKDHEE